MSQKILNWNVGLSFLKSPYMPWEIGKAIVTGKKPQGNNLPEEHIPLVADVIDQQLPQIAFLHEIDDGEQLEMIVSRLRGSYVGQLSDVCNSRYSAALLRQDISYALEKFYVDACITLFGKDHHFPGVANKNVLLVDSGLVIASFKASAGPVPQIRRNEIRQVISRLDIDYATRPAIIIGDLNMVRRLNGRFLLNSDAQLYSDLQASGFIDAAKTPQPTTANNKFILDYAFQRGTDGHVEVLDSAIGKHMDHRPIAYKPMILHIDS